MSAQFNTSFPYREVKVRPFRTSQRTIKIFRPIIPIAVIYQQKLAYTAVLLDTGADFNIFHGDVAAYLGIPLRKGSKRIVHGLKGKIVGYEHRIKVKIDKKIYNTTVIFSNQIPDNSMAVLGNRGFFEKFTVTFNYRKKIIQINR